MSATLAVSWQLQKPADKVVEERYNSFRTASEWEKCQSLTILALLSCHFGIRTTISFGSTIWFLGRKAMNVRRSSYIGCRNTAASAHWRYGSIGIFTENCDNVLVHHDSAKTTKLTRVNGHPYRQESTEITYYLTCSELSRLDSSFDHLHVDKSFNISKDRMCQHLLREPGKCLKSSDAHVQHVKSMHCVLDG